MRHWLLATIMVLLVALALNAQTFRGSINGTVVDPTGAVVPGADVKAINVATGRTLSMQSTSAGQFAFQDLQLGAYKVNVAAKGFRPVTVDNVMVSAGNVSTVSVKLSMGEATTIEVSAAAVTLDTTTVTQSDSLPVQAVQNLPLNGRDFSQLIAVAPGYGGYSGGGFGSLNGTRANQMNWQIDGVDNNDMWHNIPAVNQGGVSGIAGIVMPIDAVDEFSAQTQSNAETGRSAGGTINLVVKSGGNQFHGSAYFFDRNEFYSASSPFKPADVPQGKLRNINYGFLLSGPVRKDKDFFLVSYEKQQYIIGLSGLATEPSPAYQAKALALLSANGVSPSSISQNLMANLWPSEINNLPATVDNFFSPVASVGHSFNGVIKLDHNFSDKHHLSARWFGGQGSQTAPLGGSPALATASSNISNYFEKAPIHVYNYSIVLNSVLTPRLTNQVLVGVNYFNQVFRDAVASYNTRDGGLFLSPDALINGKPILGAPNITITGFEQIGLTPPEGRNDITGHLTDIVSYTMGKHQFRFGGELRQGQVDEFYFRNSLGKFKFTGLQGPWANAGGPCDPLNTSRDTQTCALADFLAGDVSTSSVAVGDAERQVMVNAFNFYMSDAWQVTRKLNVNYGLRYEYFGPLHNSEKNLAVFVPSLGGMKIQGNGIDSIFPADRNNFAPRIGFAYQPKENSSLVIRGGIGVFYDQINMNPFLDFRPPANTADGLEDNPAGPTPVSNYQRNGYVWTPNVAIFPGVTTCLTGKPSECGSSIFNVFSVSQNFRTPYFYNWSLNVEKSFGNAAVWQVGYVGSAGHKLSIMLDVNQNGQLTAQFPNYGSVNQLNSIGNSNYNALQSTFKIRSWHGLTSQLAYTWSHSLDFISEYRGVLPLDSTNLRAEYGNSDFDTRHNFTAYFTYDIPGSSHGPKILTHGWQLTSLLTFHSGQPFDEFRPGVFLIPGVNPIASRTFSQSGVQWLNPAAFCSPGDTGCGTNPLGNVARNSFLGPGYGDVDLSVFKNIPIKERLKMQLRAEMYNLFNRKNFSQGPGAVSGYTGKGAGLVSDTAGDFFGAPGIGPGEPFNMNLAVKLTF